MYFHRVLALFVLAQVANASLIEKIEALFSRQAKSNTTNVTPECHLTYPTDVWTTCAGLLNMYNISLGYFRYANPNISSTCDNFVPGKPYCIFVAQPSSINISSNGLCGSQQNFTNTCVGSNFGNCCSKSGYCGSSSDYCAPGNCQEGSCTGGKAYSTDGTCGSQNQYLDCPGTGACCSAYGYCGTSSDFCGSGCQGGNCTSSGTSTSAKPTSTQAPGSISQDGTCGFSGKLVCKGSKYGDCCSGAGYCGSTPYQCAALQGCQPQFGTCVAPPSSTSSASSSSSGTSKASTAANTTKATTSSKPSTSAKASSTSTK